MTNDMDGTASADVDWDAQAAVFDEEPDHGLRDPEVRRACAPGCPRGQPPTAV